MYVISLLFYLYLLFLGLDIEMFGLLDVLLNSQNHLDILSGSLILLLYIIPLLAFLIFLMKKWELPLRVLMISLISGGLIACWLSGFFNDFGDIILGELFRGAPFLDDWSNALTAPIVEEGLKAGLVFWTLYLIKEKGIKVTFFAGIAVGLGFQMMEDFAYLIDETDKISQALTRVSGGFSSHWAYTAVVVVGIYSLIHHTFDKKMSYFYLLTPILLHFLWNSPINNLMIGNLSIVSAFISAVTLFIFITLLLSIDKLPKEELSK